MLNCNGPTKDQTESKPSVDTIVTMASKKDSVPLVRPTFDFNKFTHLADSLLKRIASKTITVSCRVDTLKLEKDSSWHPIAILRSSENATLIRYEFDAHNGSPYLSFIIVEAQYTDSISAERTYSRLKKEARGFDNPPGLTYTNDFVLKNSKNIYWLNTACDYPAHNQNKLNSFLLKCTHIKNITDSIKCDCGAQECDVSRPMGSH